MKNSLSTLPRIQTPGFTLLEVVIAVAILAGVLAMLGMAMQSTLLGAECTTIHAGLDNKAAEIVDRMAKELKDGGAKFAKFAIAQDNSYVIFSRSQGYTGGATGKPLFGNQIKYLVYTDSAAGTRSLLRVESDPVTNAVISQEILTNQVHPGTYSVQGYDGSTNIVVGGLKFEVLPAAPDTIIITLVLRQQNNLLVENTAITDDTLVITARAGVQMLNN